MAFALVALFAFLILVNLYLFYFHKTAKLLSTFILIGVLPYFYCLFTKVPLGVDAVMSQKFFLRFLKYAIVNMPSLYLIYYIVNYGSIKNKKAGSLFLTIAFATNIAWTLSYGIGDSIDRQLISAMAILLVVILFLRLRTLRAQGRMGFEMKGKYLHSNLVCWNYLVPYTIWNVLFVDQQFGQIELRILHNILPFVMLGILKLRENKLTNHDLGEIYLAIRALTLALWMSVYSYYQVLYEGIFSTQKVFVNSDFIRPVSIITTLWLVHLLFLEIRKYFKAKGMLNQ